MANNSSTQPTTVTPTTDPPRKWRKRPLPPVFTGSGDFEDKDTDFLCPICFEVITEATMTKCGHTFCQGCINTSLEYNKRCPKCNFTIETPAEVYPNFLLNELIAKHKGNASSPDKKTKRYDLTPSLGELDSYLLRERGSVTLEEVNAMLNILSQRKQQLEADWRENQIVVFKEFLEKTKSHKEEEMQIIKQQLKVIECDVDTVNNMLKDHLIKYPVSIQIRHTENSSHSTTEASTSNSFQCGQNNEPQDGFNGSKYVHKIFTAPTLASRRKRMLEHFEDLEQSYIHLRLKDMRFTEADKPPADDGLQAFDDTLSKFTRFSSVRPLSSLNYTNDQFTGSNIVSSIEFDKDNEFFAIGGVTKKIKIFEYCSAIRESVEMHYPVNEMLCNSKISCISWSSFHKGLLASSDYEGTVTLWDVFTSQKTRMFQEHEKRCWSVDFNKLDGQLMASGSDDSKVKLWCTNMEHSFSTIEAKANVCCVKFNPICKNYLAFGSADHCVHYYDLRNTKQAVQILRGHKKAVSYVKFLDGNEIVSASTDSQLKLWDVKKTYCLRSFKGHVNEKNFVGLATDGDFVVCGSENNSLYVYYKGLSSQVLAFKFETFKSILEKDRKEEESNEFVSAVCWRQGYNVVVAANSQGNVKVLELI